MKHPILKSRKVFLIYILLWVLVSVFQFSMVFGELESLKWAVIGLVFFQNFALAVLLIAAWFGIRYINLETQRSFQFLLNHLIYLIVILAIWINLSNWLDSLVLAQNFVKYNAKVGSVKLLLGVFSYLLFILFQYFDAYYESYFKKLEIERKLNESLKESELNLLKTQLNPHFIFNALNSISSLTLLDSQKAQEMILKLSDFLRYMVEASKTQLVSLERELTMCQAYLDIEKVRFGEKIKIEFEIQTETLAFQVPSMMLQTLFENAIKHGVYNSLESESIFCRTYIEDDRLLIIVKNSYDDGQAKPGTKIGLKNLKNRLDLVYDKAAIVDIENDGETFRILLNLPINHEN